MDDCLLNFVRDHYFPLKGLSTFEFFTKEVAYKIYKELQDSRKENDENFDFIDQICEEHLLLKVDDEGKMFLKDLDVSKKVTKPKFEIKEKNLERIRNPKTGRWILKNNNLFKDLVEQGWIDEEGNSLKEHKVRKIRNPNTWRPLTVGSDRFYKMVESGWIDTEGKILKVRYPNTEEVISIKDEKFEELVNEGIFNRDGSLVD